MSADLLTRAIAELDRLVEASTPGVWGYRRSVLGLPNNTLSSDNGTHVAYIGNYRADDADLTVTLRRTIPAQRAMLLTAEIIIFMDTDDPALQMVVTDALDLARAILGEKA